MGPGTPGGNRDPRRGWGGSGTRVGSHRGAGGLRPRQIPLGPPPGEGY